ncbi:MAG TPA: histidine kinase N-terminal domain-containing protein [Ilumatobacteraceae bacterium]|jgi:two-component sensor histidine kinase|nr:histidine kinase N-terminal domain-containing protein [Ilumatobacteraceae bacterium]
MATLGELCRQHTSLTRDEINHLKQLVSEWGLLADLCFADLLLYVPSTDSEWLIVAQVRPATGQTLYLTDYVGVPADNERPLLASAFETSEISEGEIAVDLLPEPARMLAIPVRYGNKPIAVLSREWSNRTGRQPGELERTYLGIFQRFAAMIAEGSFPFHGLVGDSSAAPRVGDGVMVLDEEARVRYASPNAVSALHRVGISANAVGMRLAELGFNDSPVRLAYEDRMPVIEEFEQTPSVTLLTRCMPILAGGEVTGGVLLLRDVTEVRKRDKLLLSKDATIREIHHRVKNNLQTISSLLRLQGRRLESPEAKAAVAESVRRIRTIALVHETLSREPGDDVAFLEIVRPLLRLAEEGLQSPDRPVRFTVQGDGGRLPSTIATPLSVVLTELLQNAVDHGFPEGSTGGDVVVQLNPNDDQLNIRVINDGRGLDSRFELNKATGLGLSIVRTLVTTELAGTIVMRAGMPEDFAAAGLGDQPKGAGTVVDLTVPI